MELEDSREIHQSGREVAVYLVSCNTFPHAYEYFLDLHTFPKTFKRSVAWILTSGLPESMVCSLSSYG